jgi:hypothetical protein
LVSNGAFSQGLDGWGAGRRYNVPLARWDSIIGSGSAYFEPYARQLVQQFTVPFNAVSGVLRAYARVSSTKSLYASYPDLLGIFLYSSPDSTGQELGLLGMTSSNMRDTWLSNSIIVDLLPYRGATLSLEIYSAVDTRSAGLSWFWVDGVSFSSRCY